MCKQSVCIHITYPFAGDQFFCKFNVTNIPEYMDFLGALFCGREFDNDHQLGTRGLLWGMRAPYIKRHDSCATTRKAIRHELFRDLLLYLPFLTYQC